MPSHAVPSDKESTFDLEIVGVVRRRWKLILFGISLGIAFAALYQFSATRIYESNIEVLIGQRSSEMTTSGTASSAAASGDSIATDQLATHMQLFMGRRNLAEAIDKHELGKLNSFQLSIKKNIHPIDHLLNNLDVQRGGKGSARDAMVIRASFRDTSAEDAAIVLAAVYESYRDYVESHGQSSGKEAMELIEAARQTHEEELASADEEYRTFISSVPVLLDGDKVRDIHKDRLESLEKELNEVRSSLAQSTSRLELIRSYLEKPELLESNDSSHLALLSQKEVERLQLFLDVTRGEAQSEAFVAEQPAREEAARAQYTRLLALLQTERTLAEDYGANHPLVAATQKEIQVIQEFISKNAPASSVAPGKKLGPKEMLSTYTMLLENDIAELTKREQILISDSASELALAKEVEASFLKGSSLKAQLNRAQLRYDEVIRRLQELNLAGNYAGFSTDLLSHAEVEQKASWPKLPIVIALGGIFGTLLGACLAIASELFDVTFRDAHDLEQSLGATAIAHIPRIDLKAVKKEIGESSKLDTSLVAFHMPRCPESELYRVARTSLMVKTRQLGATKLMMTSPHPGDGKSTTISNLAISLAQVGKRVLLIDADMRRPVIGGLFGVESSPGLTDALLELTSLNDCFHSTEVENLTIMPHGSRTQTPAELLESNQLGALLEACEKQFDFVLVDAPPLLAVADPAIIAPQVDAVILTVRIRKNGRRPVERAVRILRDIDVTPTAIVINATEKNGSQGGYGYSNGYSSEEYSYVGYYHEYGVKESTQTQKSLMPSISIDSSSNTKAMNF